MRVLAALWLSLAMSVPSALAQRTPTTAPATAPAPARPDPAVPLIKYDRDGITPQPVFMAAHERFIARGKQGPVDLLFLGDSITAGWGNNGNKVWKRRYAARKAAHFGISGDRTEHVLWRIENGELDAIKPKVIVLMIGTNNVTGLDDPDRIAAGVTRIVRTAQAKTGAKVLLLGIFPRGATAAQAKATTNPRVLQHAPRTDPYRETIARVNAILATLDDGKTVRYLDLKDRFMHDDGAISTEDMYDYLHLTPAGYAIWADAMEPLLSEMLNNVQ